ncbi:hypothetical protein BDR07DRAFT_1609725 [Suillus spraguei]|nr:hypothetical protein BDR07DRAFT_1609725 [Suillus spraguei]
MLAKILVILSAFAVYIIAAPYPRPEVGGGAYTTIGAEDTATEAEFLTPTDV